MSDELVLIAGAAGGQQGKTGRHVAELLLARGVPVRAFVHKIDERSDRLRALGAEVVEISSTSIPSSGPRRAFRLSISLTQSRPGCSKRPRSWPTPRARPASPASSTW